MTIWKPTAGLFTMDQARKRYTLGRAIDKALAGAAWSKQLKAIRGD